MVIGEAALLALKLRKQLYSLFKLFLHSNEIKMEKKTLISYGEAPTHLEPPQREVIQSSNVIQKPALHFELKPQKFNPIEKHMSTRRKAHCHITITNQQSHKKKKNMVPQHLNHQG